MKKIIFSICIIILYIIFGNITYVEAASSYAATVTNDGKVSYITAGDYKLDDYNNLRLGQKKMSFYNTQGLTASTTKSGLDEYWYGKNTLEKPYYLPSFYKQGIWREKIGGSDAFCLNPGLKISRNGYTPEGTAEVKNFLSLGNEEKIYATIYYADFTNFNIYYNYMSGATLPKDENTQYIIKQILFWAYQNNKDLFNIGSGSIFLKPEVVSQYKYIEGTHSYSLLYEDIATALLHYAQKDYEGTNNIKNLKDDFWISSSNINFGYSTTVISKNLETFESIQTILQNSYKYLFENNPEVKITKYKPEDPNTQQYFIGIYIPPVYTNVQKKYAIIDNYGGSNHLRTDYTTLSKDGANVGYNTGLEAYTCVGYDVYVSSMDYGSATKLVGEVIKSKSGSGNSYNLDYANAGEYNVIVFKYNEQPKYKVTCNYYYKSASSTSYTLLETKASDDKKAKAKVSISKKYSDTYNTTLYNGYDKSTSLSNLSDSGDNIEFDMPADNVTINIYYQYGQLTVQKVIRNNNGTETNYGSPSVNNLTSSQSVNLSEFVKSGSTTYYYFKYVNGSTTKYWSESGYTKGSNVTIAKGKNNITVKLYYGLRKIDYAHLLKSGTEYRNLESNSVTKYDSWGEVSNVVSAKSTPWYISLDSTYLRLKYIGGKYLNGNDSDNITATNLRKNGTSFSVSDFSLGGMTTENATDTTRVEFYYEIVPSTKVIVRHLVKQADGKYKIDNSLANGNAVIKNAEAYSGMSKGAYAIVSNGYSQRKSVYKDKISVLSSKEQKVYVTGSCSEFYEIDQSDEIIIDRSRTLISNGVYYNCVGFKTLKSSEKNPLDINLNDINKTSSLQQVITGGPKYVFIDYYYDPEDYSKDVYDNSGSNNGIGNSARLKFMPKASGSYASLGNSVVTSNVSGANENENIAYVPVTENLKPYVVTDICRVRTAKYGIAISNDDLVYNVATYTAWGVSDDDNMANVQSIIGGDVKQVYNNSTYMNINKSTVQSNISSTFNYVKNISSSFEGNATLADESFKGILSSVSSKKTTESYYNNSNSYDIASNKYNGLRQPTGNISYKIYTISSSGIVSKTGNTNSNITANNSMRVNIYTPATVGDVKISSIDFVNHSNLGNNTAGIIQQGVEFSVTVSTKKDKSYGSVYGNIKNTGKYVKDWYLMFDFDVNYRGKIYKANEECIRVTANHGNIYAETTISGIQAITNSTDMTTISSTLNHVKAIASTINLPSYDYANRQLSRTDANKNDTSVKHIDKEYIKLRNNSSSPKSQSDGLGMTNDSYYLVSDIEETISIGRIFDFEITDCLDVNFKDVFRILNSNDNSVNSLTGTRYFSGIRRLLALDSVTSTTTNSLVPRSNLLVGSVTKILPLGPYKHTTNAYIQSVKLGYRFSFDVKTSGYYDPNVDDVTRSVRITPSYYYISKDGTTYNDNIKLYYKNSSGNYVDFETSNYTIYYKPNDGYRNTYNSGSYNEGVAVDKTKAVDRTTLTTSLVGLNISKAFTLSSDKSMTTSDNKYLQAWYGEFKIPNSTIALAVDNKGNIDINNPLTDGYIGVKFEIECIDKYKGRTEDVIVSYGNNDKGIGNNATNTSQWDYEGYLGFKESNVGSSLSENLKIQLENGVWKIDDNMYQKIKGTVILYDLDNRAANDYD